MLYSKAKSFVSEGDYSIHVLSGNKKYLTKSIYFQHTNICKVIEPGKEEREDSKRDTLNFLRQKVSQLDNIANLDNGTAKQMLETTVR